jgi:hypothetical protein
MRRERKRQTEHRSELRAERARSEQPDRDPQSRTWHSPDHLAGLQRSQQGLQFHDIMGEILGGRGQIRTQRARGSLIGAGGAAGPEIDAAPVKRFQRTELLCDDQRRMVWQHHAARSNTNGPGAAGDIADHHRGRSAGDAGHIMMLGEPEPLVIPAFGVLRQIEPIVEGLGRIAALIDRRQVQNREGITGISSFQIISWPGARGHTPDAIELRLSHYLGIFAAGAVPRRTNCCCHDWITPKS